MRHSSLGRATPCGRGDSRSRQTRSRTMQPQPSLNLIPTIQQAITSLLMTHEPEFIRFGYRLFTAFATILISWHGVRMMFSHEGLNDRMFEFAKLLVFISFGYSFIAFYETPAAGRRGVVQQPDHRPGGLLPVGARGPGVRQHLPALRHAVGPLHAARPVVDPGEPDLLDGAAAGRLRQGRVAGRHRVRSDRQRRVRSARSHLRPVLHRPEAGLAVLGMASRRSSSTRSSRSWRSRS